MESGLRVPKTKNLRGLKILGHQNGKAALLEGVRGAIFRRTSWGGPPTSATARYMLTAGGKAEVSHKKFRKGGIQVLAENRALEARLGCFVL